MRALRERLRRQRLAQRIGVHFRLDVEPHFAFACEGEELGEARDARAVERLLLWEMAARNRCRGEAGRRRSAAARRRSSEWIGVALLDPFAIRAARDGRVEAAVVVHHHDAVPRHADVELERGDAELQRELEGGQRVLGQVAARAAVALHVHQRIICVCVVTERSLPASSVMRVSQTCVRLPLWIGFASACTKPERQPAMKLVFDSSVAVRWPSRQVRHRAGRADGVGEGHQRAAVDRAADRHQPLVDLQARHHAIGRHLDELDAEVRHQAGIPLDFHLEKSTSPAKRSMRSLLRTARAPLRTWRAAAWFPM